MVQSFFPAYEIARGQVWTGEGNEAHYWGEGNEAHYWNLDPASGDVLDLSWSQFPPGSRVVSFEVLDRANLGDSPATQLRVELLLSRVRVYLADHAA